MQKIRYSRPHWEAGYMRKERGTENFRPVYQSNNAGEVATYSRRNGSECKVIRYFDGTPGKMKPVWTGNVTEFKERFQNEIDPSAARANAETVAAAQVVAETVHRVTLDW